MDNEYKHILFKVETVQAIANVLSQLPYKDVAYVISLMQQDELEYQESLSTDEK